MRKTFFTSLLLAVISAGVSAEVIPIEEINSDNINKFGGSMYEYVAPEKSPAKPPKGFKPFYISHYGRHGSRYLLERPQYHQPYDILKAAQEKGVLTEFGKSVLDRVEIMMNDAEGHLGDLTRKGMRQHQGITHRMVENYPQLFGKDAYIEARSTTSQRVILSMMAGLNEIARMRPDLKIDFDATGVDAYLSRIEPEANSLRNSRERSTAFSEFCARHTHPQRMMTALFTDTTFITRYEVEEEVRQFPMQGNRTATRTTVKRVQDMSGDLYGKITDLAANMQSHDLGIDLNDVLTPEEWYESFIKGNLYWYSVSAFTPVTEDLVPYGVCPLLKDFIDKADKAIVEGGITANLRYGHDTYLFPLLCLMDINDCNYSSADFDDVSDVWVSYDIVHMASNIQMVFFRDRKDKVIVQVLVNEEPAEIPVGKYVDVKGREHEGFYDWMTLRKYYLDKISFWENKKAELAAN